MGQGLGSLANRIPFARSIPRLAVSGALACCLGRGLAELSVNANRQAYGADHTGSPVDKYAPMENPRIGLTELFTSCEKLRFTGLYERPET